MVWFLLLLIIVFIRGFFPKVLLFVLLGFGVQACFIGIIVVVVFQTLRGVLKW